MALSPLCSICQQALCPDLLEEGSYASERRGPHHATHGSFLTAIANGCVICATVKKLIERSGRITTGGIDADCFPFSYSYIHEELVPPIQFSVHYRIPSQWEGMPSTCFVALKLSPRRGPNSLTLDHPHPPYAESSTSSSPTLELAMDWINNCRTCHAECRQLQKLGNWSPTRLIDLGKGEGQWKLVSFPDKLQPPPIYITLSYRWGSSENFRLLKKNLEAFQNGLPVADLPRTFQDAASVALRLSVRFLWIDALCIVQDCDKDWSHESAAMRLVYANALCNIAAVASSDPNGGLFRDRNPKVLEPIVVRAALDKSTPVEEYYAVDDEYIKHQLLEKELLRRGWVFQERLLCPRVLYFAEEQVFWECFTEQRCETFPHGIPRPQSSKSKFLSTITDFRNGQLATDEGLTLLIVQDWESIVDAYTDCELTKASDRLFAIEGVADLFRNTFHDTYVFGLWKMGLARQMSYYVKYPREESSSKCIAPSWSWASLHSPVKFNHASWLSSTTEHVSVLDVDPIQTSLTLRGSLFTAKIDTQSEYNLVVDDYRTYADIYPDKEAIQADIPEFITLLPLISYQNHRGPALDLLILEPIFDTTSRSYRRIAYMKLDQGQDIALLDMMISQDSPTKVNKVAPSIISLI